MSPFILNLCTMPRLETYFFTVYCLLFTVCCLLFIYDPSTGKKQNGHISFFRMAVPLMEISSDCPFKGAGAWD
jgi:hypothetical protein